MQPAWSSRTVEAQGQMAVSCTASLGAICQNFDQVLLYRSAALGQAHGGPPTLTVDVMRVRQTLDKLQFDDKTTLVVTTYARQCLRPAFERRRCTTT